MNFWASLKKPLFLVVSIFLAVALALPVVADTLVVSKENGEFSSIQEAIDAAESGGTVLVKEGTYEENLTINKDLTLKATEEAKVTIKGTDQGTSLISLSPSQSEITITRITLMGKDNKASGIEVKGKSTLTLNQCKVVNNDDSGIEILDSSQAYIIGSTIRNNGEGIVVRDSSRAELISNEVKRNEWEGINVSSSSKTTIQDNQISRNGEGGINVWQSGGLEIASNVISNNRMGGILIEEAAGVSVRDNEIGENPGIGFGVLGCSKLMIKENKIRKNNVGLFLVEKSDEKTKLFDNEIEGNLVNFAGAVKPSMRNRLMEPKKEEISFPDDRYPTLQHAIDALLPGGELVLENDVRGGVVIDKEIKIKSSEKVAKLSLDSAYTPVFSLINGADLKLKNVRITNPKGMGIIQGGDSTIRVLDSVIIDNEHGGIWILDSAQATIARSLINNNGELAGIRLLGSAKAVINENSISENYTGIEIYNPDEFSGTLEGYGNWFLKNDSNFSGVKDDKQKELKAENEPSIDDLEIVRRKNHTLLTWTNPDDPLVENVTVRRKRNSYPQDHTSGEKVECQIAKAKVELGVCIDLGLTEGKTYYYSIFSQNIHGLWDDKLVEDKNGVKIYIKKRVMFEDKNLEDAIREAIDKPEGDIYVSGLKELKKLSAEGVGIENLRGLENCTGLIELDLSENKISQIDPLAKLINLEKLDLRDNRIKELTPLSSLAKLNYLNLDANRISDISPLRNNPGLGEDSTISLYRNYLDLSEDSKDKKDLKKLQQSGTEVHFEYQRSPIEIPNPQLEKVIRNTLSNAQGNLYDKDLKKITSLDASERGISNLEGIGCCSHLKELDLRDNEIKDISPLSKLDNLKKLDLSQNKVTDLSPLVYNEGLDEGDILDLKNNRFNLIQSSKNLKSIKKLENRGVQVSYKPQKTIPFFEQENYYRVVLRLKDVGDISQENVNEMVEKTKKTLQARGDQYGLADTSFTSSSEDKLVVNTSANYEYRKVQDLFARQGLLVFKKVVESGKPGETLKTSGPSQEILHHRSIDGRETISYVVKETPLLVASKYLEKVQVKTSQSTVNPIFISFELNREGGEKFAKVIKSLKPNEERVAIVIDGVVQSAPLIRQALWDHANESKSVRAATIQDDFSLKEANKLAISLRNGSLPVKVDVINSTTYKIDSHLENALIEEIGKSRKNITRADLENITKLNANEKEISSLLGIEFCKNLEEINLASNSIRDVSALSSLENLEKLDLRGNGISDITPLVNNKGLGEGDTVLLNENQLNLSRGSEDAKNIASLRERGVEIPEISTHIVSKDTTTYNSVQEAINTADPGDTVFVKEGIYEESLKINKNLKLVGRDPEKVTIRSAEGYPALLIGPSKAEVKVKGVGLTNARDDCCYDFDKGICPAGISITGEALATITNSVVSENSYGIRVAKSSEAKIRRNEITGNNFGIMALPGTKVLGSENKMVKNEINFFGNLSDELRKPLQQQTKKIIKFPNLEYPSLQHAVDALLPGGTLLIEAGKYKVGVTIGKELTIKPLGGGRPVFTNERGDREPSAVVVSLVRGAKVKLESVTIKNGGWGLVANSNAEVNVINSVFSDNGFGIGALNEARATIKSAQILNNQDKGLYLWNSAQVTLKSSTIKGNKHGIEIYEPDSFRGSIDGYDNQISDNKTSFKGVTQRIQKMLLSKPQSPITDFQVKAKEGMNSLSWTNSEDSKIESLTVRRKQGDYPRGIQDGKGVKCEVNKTAGAKNTCVDINLEPGKKYYYGIFTKLSSSLWIDVPTPGKNVGYAVVKGERLPSPKADTLVQFDKDKRLQYSLILKTGEETIKGLSYSNFIGKRKVNGESVETQKLVTMLKGEKETTFNFYSKRDDGLYIIGTKGPSDIKPQVLKDPYVVLEHPVGVGYGWETPMALPIPDKEIVVNVNETVTSVDSQITVPAGNFDNCVKTEFNGSKVIKAVKLPLLEMSSKNHKKYLFKVQGSSWLAPGVGEVQAYVKISSYDPQTEELLGALTLVEKLESF